LPFARITNGNFIWFLYSHFPFVAVLFLILFVWFCIMLYCISSEKMGCERCKRRDELDYSNLDDREKHFLLFMLDGCTQEMVTRPHSSALLFPFLIIFFFPKCSVVYSHISIYAVLPTSKDQGTLFSWGIYLFL
jgi:hypothetical protein